MRVVEYIKNHFEATPVKFSVKLCEDVWAAIKLQGGEKLIVGCIYRSPNSTTENNEKLCQLLKEVSDMQTAVQQNYDYGSL